MTLTTSTLRIHFRHLEYCQVCGKFEMGEGTPCEEDESSFGGETVKRMAANQSQISEVVLNKDSHYPHEFEIGPAIA